MPAERSAHALLERLNAVDARHLTGELLHDAEAFFRSRGDEARARWMSLERDGYGARTEVTDLHDLFGGAADDVVSVVATTRFRYGRVLVAGAIRRWPHFFVESVDELGAWNARVGHAGPPTIELELDTSIAGGPRRLSFSRGVFGALLFDIGVEIGVALQQARGAA